MYGQNTIVMNSKSYEAFEYCHIKKSIVQLTKESVDRHRNPVSCKNCVWIIILPKIFWEVNQMNYYYISSAPNLD